MNTSRQSRRRLSIGAESLESRNLLNAHVPHVAAHVAAVHAKADQIQPPPASTLISQIPGTPVSNPLVPLKAPKPPKAPHEISGTVTGLSSYTVNPNNGNQGYDFYSTASLVKSGTATYIGTDSFTSTPISPTTFKDTYFNGFTVLDLPAAGDFSVSYVGNGKSPVQSGPYTATFTGKAIGITGAFTGHEYSFKATVTGNEVSDAVTIKFTLKD